MLGFLGAVKLNSRELHAAVLVFLPAAARARFVAADFRAGATLAATTCVIRTHLATGLFGGILKARQVVALAGSRDKPSP